MLFFPSMRKRVKGILIGNPVDKSISHLTHNALLKLCDIDGVYEKLSIIEEEFEEKILFLRQGNYRWIAVTMPYKEKIIPYLDELSPDASAIDAVNMISIEEGRWIGHNTDGLGALNAIERIERVFGMDLIILGAGGTAKAIAYEAKKRGANVFICNRTVERAHKLAGQIGVTQIEEIPARYDCIINATSIGMSPQNHLIPIEKNKVLGGAVLLDVIYAPRKTALIQLGEEKGCKTVLGEEMFAELSHAQFKIVFENQISLSLVRQMVTSSVLAISSY